MSKLNVEGPPKDGPDALVAVLRILAEVGPGAIAGFIVAGPGGSVIGAGVTVVICEVTIRHFFPHEHNN